MLLAWLRLHGCSEQRFRSKRAPFNDDEFDFSRHDFLAELIRALNRETDCFLNTLAFIANRSVLVYPDGALTLRVLNDVLLARYRFYRAYESIILMSRNNTKDAGVIHRRNKSSGLKLEYSLCSRVKIPARIPVKLPTVVSWRAMQTIECCIGGRACIFMPLTVMQAYHLSRVVREHRCSRPFAYAGIRRRGHTCTVQVHTGNLLRRNFYGSFCLVYQN